MDKSIFLGFLNFLILSREILFKYNPQNEMFAPLKTRRSLLKNEA